MKVLFSKKRTVIATLILIGMSMILWIYPEFIKNQANIKGTIIIFFVSIIFLYVKFEFNEVVKGILAGGMLLLLPCLFFPNIQEPYGKIESMITGAFWLNIGLILVFEIILFLIFNRTRIVGIISTVVLTFLGISNMVVYSCRGRTISPADMHSLRTALGVSSNYTFVCNDLVIKNILYLVMFLIIFMQLNFKVKKLKNRGMVIGGSIILGIICFTTIFQLEWLNKKGFVENQFVPMSAVKSMGYFGDFYINSYGLKVKKPSEYDAGIIKKVYEQYESSLPVNENAINPNIIIIMNESFSDLDALDDISYNIKPLSFFNSLSKNTIRGNLVSSVFGGNTPNSEFECLTGASLAFFPQNAIVYQQFLHSEIPSSVSAFSDLGYYTFAIHPYNKIYWERDRVYPEVLGFDEFISEDTMDDPLRIRDYISDETVFDIILERLKTDKEGERIFNFSITMQNHGGYYFGMTDIQALEINDPYVNEYLSLMKVTDDAFRKFIREVEKLDEPTIVCMFGDHQPRFGDSVYDAIWENSDISESEKEIRKHIVPFVIWANYDIEEKEYLLTSINYLSPMIFDTAGFNQLPYYQYLLDLQKEYPSVSALGCFDAKYAFHIRGEEMDEIPELQKYSSIQYNYIYDEKHRYNNFFEYKNK